MSIVPKVFLIGETRIVSEGLQGYLEHLGVPDWTSDAPSDPEKLIEVNGRLCYKSFVPGLNPNVTRIRESNKDYLGNIIKVRHGSVIEHANVNFVFADVSRVFTHELVRHRVGTGISQESLRFVRIQTIADIYTPTIIKENDDALEIWVDVGEKFDELYQYLERSLADIFKLDDPATPFHLKKIVTSALRRRASDGIPTNIGWSANMRTLRQVIEARTEPGAEEEIRLVFGEVGRICMQRYPNLFADYEIEIVDGLPWYKTPNRKV